MINMDKGISVLISTKDRLEDLQLCINSILKSKFDEFEILICDQSEKSENFAQRLNIYSSRVKIFRSTEKGRSKGLNFLSKKAKFSIIAFTDDDCIVDDKWLSEIFNTYKRYPQISGVFGKTLPYLINEQASYGKICPSQFLLNELKIHRWPKFHFYEVGVGNDMSIKRDVMLAENGFLEWLGVGAIGEGAEEYELIYRLLKKKYLLVTNPKIIVFHNRWIKQDEDRKLQILYIKGIVSFLAYYILSENWFRSIKYILFKIYERLKLSLIRFLLVQSNFLQEGFFLLLELKAIYEGICLGLKKKIGSESV